MAEAKTISCAAGAWTALSTAGQLNVSFRSARSMAGKMTIATSAPSVNATDFYPLDGYEKINLGSLGASDIVYYMAAVSDETIYVLRGA